MTISSQGQVTIPAKVRRQLGLGKRVQMDLRGRDLIIRPEPSLEDIQAILRDAPRVKPTQPESAWAKAAIEKDLRKRGC